MLKHKQMNFSPRNTDGHFLFSLKRLVQIQSVKTRLLVVKLEMNNAEILLLIRFNAHLNLRVLELT